MAFDPDAFLGAPSSTPRGFDPDAFLGAGSPPPIPEAKEDPSMLEAGLRGVKQGVTLGFGDELTGALESAFTSKTYKQARDEARANDKAAREAHPIAFGAGEIAGGVGGALATGGLGGALGAAGIGARIGTGIAGSIVRGAGAGIAQGIGDSEADSVAGIAKDAGRGGLMGGALGGVTHGLSRILGGKGGIVGGAPERESATLLDDIGTRATKEQRDKLFALGPENVVATAREHGLADVARNPRALKEAADKAVATISEETAGVQRAIDQKVGNVDAEKLVDSLGKMRDKLAANPATQDQAAKVDRVIEKARATWLPEPPAAPASPLEGRELLAAVAKGGAGKTRERLAMKAGDVEKVIDEFKLRPLATDAEAFAGGVAKSKSEVGKLIGEYDKAIDAASPGVPLTDVMKAMHKVEQAYSSNPATRDVANIVAKKIEDVRAAWQGLPAQKGIPMVPFPEMRKLASGLAESGFAGSMLDPKTTSKIQRQAWGAVKDLIDEHAESTIKRMHGLGFEGFTAKPGEFASLNRQYSILSDLDKAAQRRALTARITPPKAAPIAAPVAEKTGKVLPFEARDFADKLKMGGDDVHGVLNAEATRAAPDLSSKLAGLNAKRQTLEAIRDAAEQRAQETPYSPTGLRAIAGSHLDKLALGASILTHNPLPYVATHYGPAAAAAASRGATKALARLVQASRAGNVPAKLVQEALEAGVPRGTVEATVSALGRRQEAQPVATD